MEFKVADGTTDICRDQIQRLSGERSKPTNFSVIAQHYDCDLNTSEKVNEIVIGLSLFKASALQFIVHGGEFFVTALQLFLGRLQFLVCALEFLVGALKFFIRGRQIFLRCFGPLNERLLILLVRGQLLLQFCEIRVIILAESDLSLAIFRSLPGAAFGLC